MNENGFRPTDEAFEEPKKGNKLLVFVVLIIIAIVVIVAGIFVQQSQPMYVFFDKVIDKCFEAKYRTDFDTLKVNADMELVIASEDESIAEVAELLEDTKISIHSEMDKESLEQILSLGLTKDGEELLDIDAKLDANAQKAYLKLGDWFDKTIAVDIEPEENPDISVEDFSDIDYEKAKSILHEEVRKHLKKEYFSSSKESINGEKVKKNTLKLSASDMSEVIINIASDLKENSEFLNCFKEVEDIKSSLEDLIEQTEDEFSYETGEYIIIDLYTKGWKKDFVGIDFSSEQYDERDTVEIRKIAENTYTYAIYTEDVKSLEGQATYTHNENGDFSLEFSIKSEEDGEISVKLGGNITYDEALSSFDTSDSVDYEGLTEEDYNTILNNFMESKLYEVITEFYGEASTNYMDNSDDFSSAGSSNVSALPTADNAVRTSDGTIEVSFKIPSTIEVDDVSENSYKYFKKEGEDGEESRITVEIYERELEEYFEFQREYAEEYYDEVRASNEEEVTVEGKTFYKMQLNYEAYGEAQEALYFAYELDNGDLYIVEIENSKLLEQSEIEDFLRIEVKQ